MGEVKVYLSDELDKRFRKAAMDAYGYGRGSISKAAEEAFLEWCRKRERTSPASEEAQSTSETTPEKPGPALQERMSKASSQK